ASRSQSQATSTSGSAAKLRTRFGPQYPRPTMPILSAFTDLASRPHDSRGRRRGRGRLRLAERGVDRGREGQEGTPPDEEDVDVLEREDEPAEEQVDPALQAFHSEREQGREELGQEEEEERDGPRGAPLLEDLPVRE